MTVIAPVGQFFWHFMQPMQEALQTFIATAPLSLLLQSTVTLEAFGIISMIFCGQVLEQIAQPMQRRGSTWAMPFSMQIASCGQAAAQSPQPRQP